MKTWERLERVVSHKELQGVVSYEGLREIGRVVRHEFLEDTMLLEII